MDDPSGTQVSTEATESPRAEFVEPAVAPLPSRSNVPASAGSAKSDPPPQNGTSATKGSAPPPPADNAPTSFWLSHSDQVVLATVAAVGLVLFAAYSVRATHWGTVPIEIDRLPQRQFEYRIDVNSATWVEWGQLERIGDSLARRIVADREQNGPFRSIDDLRRVKGIGPKTLEHMRPWLTIGSEKHTSARGSGADPAEMSP